MLSEWKTCTSCNTLCLLSEFYNRKESGISNQCKRCEASHKTKVKKSPHPKSSQLGIKRGTYQKHKVRARKTSREYAKIYRLRAMRKIATAHNSFAALYCFRCGFSDIRALQIDHINGGGTKELDTISSGGLYARILNLSEVEIRNAYQILCANCNMIKKEENRENYIWKNRDTT